MAADDDYYVQGDYILDGRTGDILAQWNAGRGLWEKETGLNKRQKALAELAIQETDAFQAQMQVRLQQMQEVKIDARREREQAQIEGELNVRVADGLHSTEDDAPPDWSAPVTTSDPTPVAEKMGSELDPADIGFEDFLDSNEKSVTSSNIASINWSNGVVRVSFHKGHGYYYYGNVSYSEYQSFLLADSVGKYFHTVIKNKPMFHR